MIVLTLGFWLVPTAYAATPDQTGAFVAYCADKRNMKECIGTMMMIETGDEMAGRSDVCTVPDGIAPERANNEMLDWMRSHPAYGKQSLHDGMQAAMQDLWGCAKTLNNGLTSAEAPDTAGAFLAFCSAQGNANKCAAEIETDYGVARLDRKGGCSVPDNITPEDLMSKTLQWLRAHPQPASERTETAITAAMAGIWPCN